MSTFSLRHKDLCLYTGIFGSLLSLTCLIQHFAITVPHWITACMAAIYIFAIVTFILLALQNVAAPLLLAITTVAAVVADIILTRNGVFSLIVVLLHSYSVGILVVLLTEGVPRKLKQRAIARRAENQLWKDKI